jgi:hypothetical protein
MSDYELLKRIAEKACEPMSDTADGSKTIGQWRSEMGDLITEVVNHVMQRERAIKERAEKEAAHPYVYCQVEAGRKSWHLDNEFDDWDTLDRDRDDYTDTYVFRKLRSALSDKDAELVKQYGIRYLPPIHDLMTARWEQEEKQRLERLAAQTP